MSGSEQRTTMKRSLSEEAQDDLSPPKKVSSAEVRLKGKAWTKHPRFYFEDGSLTLLVDGTAYRVQASILAMYSPHWKDLLGSEPKESYEPQELDDISKQEIDAFFSLLYPSSFERHDNTTEEDWAYVLNLSNIWQITSMLSLALSKLDVVARPLHKLVLARSFDVPRWVDPSIDALARRAEPLTLDEANMLGMRDVLLISAAREKIRTIQPVAGPATRAPAPNNPQAQPTVGVPRTAPAPAPVKPPLPEITVPFTRKELEELSRLLPRSKDLEKVFAIVTMEKVPAFCHAAADFSNLLTPNILGHGSFSSALFEYVATKPTYIPVAVKLASFITLQHESTEPTFGQLFQNMSGLRSSIHDDVCSLRTLWTSVGQAKTKYPDFSLAFKSGSRNSSAGRLLGFSSYEESPSEGLYNQRSANAQRFITALSADNVNLVK
ncbi:hypothetical protein PENSPDRAFT_631485 [Peniophora sp. CONT]|nr:hypothetical protein PENSPDRAFT_631485 [Peniophora sp. CONT]